MYADHTFKDISVKKSFVFSRAILKWFWDVIVFCSTPEQTVISAGNWLKIGILSLLIITRSHSLTHSLISTKYVAATKIVDMGCYLDKA